MARLEITRDYILAGNATFTAHNGAGNWYTFKVTRKESAQYGLNYFASFLSGQDNESDFTYLGVIDPEYLRLRITRKSRQHEGSTPVRALTWALDMLSGRVDGSKCPAAEILPSTRCCRCGRKLTTPDSVKAGIGPECAGRGAVAPVRPAARVVTNSSGETSYPAIERHSERPAGGSPDVASLEEDLTQFGPEASIEDVAQKLLNNRLTELGIHVE